VTPRTVRTRFGCPRLHTTVCRLWAREDAIKGRRRCLIVGSAGGIGGCGIRVIEVARGCRKRGGRRFTDAARMVADGARVGGGRWQARGIHVVEGRSTRLQEARREASADGAQREMAGAQRDDRTVRQGIVDAYNKHIISSRYIEVRIKYIYIYIFHQLLSFTPKLLCILVFKQNLFYMPFLLPGLAKERHINKYTLDATY
jgi:hypothetical protein